MTYELRDRGGNLLDVLPAGTPAWKLALSIERSLKGSPDRSLEIRQIEASIKREKLCRTKKSNRVSGGLYR